MIEYPTATTSERGGDRHEMQHDWEHRHYHPGPPLRAAHRRGTATEQSRPDRHSDSHNPPLRVPHPAFEQGLRALGYVEGQSLVIEFRMAEGNVERLPALAAELVQRNVDVLVAGGPEVILRAVRQAPARSPLSWSQWIMIR